MAKGKEVMVPVSDEQLALLRQNYPTEMGFNRTLLPRFGLVSQDVTEEVRDPKTKKKSLAVIAEAGTLFLERQGDEVDEETNQKKWEREDLGTETDGVILYQRKQLKFYDQGSEEFTSSPVYDTDDQVLPLFLNKKEVDRGTPAELQARKQYQGQTAAGKATSKLEINRILYVLLKGEVFQLNLRGSSMYSFLKYARTTLVPSMLTTFSSEHQEKGTIEWHMMTFKAARALTGAEVSEVLEKQADIKHGIEAEKAYYAAQTSDQIDLSKAAGESDEDAEARHERLKKF